MSSSSPWKGNGVFLEAGLAAQERPGKAGDGRGVGAPWEGRAPGVPGRVGLYTEPQGHLST